MDNGICQQNVNSVSNNGDIVARQEHANINKHTRKRGQKAMRTLQSELKKWEEREALKITLKRQEEVEREAARKERQEELVTI